MDGDRRGGKLRKITWVLAALVVGGAALVTLRTGPPPTVEIKPGLPGIGRRTPVRVVFEEPVRGLSHLRVELVQGERTVLLDERQHAPRPPWAFWGERTAREEIELEVGSETVEGLTGGEATLRASAWPAPTAVRKPAAVVAEVTLPVRLTPPSLAVLSRQHYVAQGGAEAVVYHVGESGVRDGVAVGDDWFPGFDLPGGATGDRFALFCVPFDLADSTAIRLAAEDDVGNRVELRFVDQFFPKRFKSDDLEITDAFMERVVPAIMAATPTVADRGSLLDNYLEINGELRRANAATLAALASSSPSEFLWSRPFLPMPNAQVMSAFADRRTYLYAGKVVDHQDHLGFDLASVTHAEVPAANRGIVALAEYFGIYGNAVVLDHGYGLMSLYGHLSSIDVKAGETVERGQTIGRTGATGLAGGDHLHFTMLLQGKATNPVEWWDGGWIRDRLSLKLGAAFPYQP